MSTMRSKLGTGEAAVNPAQENVKHGFCQQRTPGPAVGSRIWVDLLRMLEAAVFPHVEYEGVQLALELVALAEWRKTCSSSRRLRSILQRSCQWQAISALAFQ
jgi:hypothetical protein